MEQRVQSDRELIERVVAHDHAALGELYDRYVRPVYALALKIMHSRERAEEVVQEVFAKIWRKPASYNPERGAFINWVLGVTHNQAIDHLQKERNYDNSIPLDLAVGDEDEGRVAPQIVDEAADPSDAAWLSVQAGIVKQALVELPTAQRQVIELAYFTGLTQVEIAARLNEPLGTVKTRTRLAMQKLKVSLQDKGLKG